MLIASCAIAKTDIWETTKVNLGFIGVLLVVLLLCTYVPWFSLALIELVLTNSRLHDLAPDDLRALDHCLHFAERDRRAADT